MPKKPVIKLRQLLKEKDITLRELARLADCRHATLSQWQTKGIESMNLQLLANVYEALELESLDELIEIVDDDSGFERK